MIGVEIPPGTVEAAGLVGTVLVQALALYVGYGGLERIVGPRLTALIEGGS